MMGEEEFCYRKKGDQKRRKNIYSKKMARPYVKLNIHIS